MSLPRIYQILPEHAQNIELSPQAGFHIATVLRLQVGDPVILFNGQGIEYQATIETIRKKHVRVQILSQHATLNNPPLHIHLFQGISKGDRMDWVVQKAVELGVSEITPLWTEQCAIHFSEERVEKKVQHWREIIIAACEQCGQNHLPRLNAPCHFKDILSGEDAFKLIAHPKASINLKTYPPQSALLYLAIGPEGGFSEREIEAACQENWHPFHLGHHILRTETAAIASLGAIQALWGVDPV